MIREAKRKSSPRAPEKKIAIIGLGLLGSSLGLALKNSGFRRIGWSRRREAREDAMRTKVVDQVFDSPEKAVSDADITVVCLPIPNIISFCSDYAAHFKRGAIVTDVGSVKEIIVKKCASVLDKHKVQFIGSHPMAGSEKSGAEAAQAALYRGATVFVAPAEGASEDAIRKIKKLWEKTGAFAFCVTPKQHDLIVAHTSHLPHIVAAALVKSALDNDRKIEKMRGLGAAGGFRDVSRVASSNPKMWREIIESNKTAALKALSSFQTAIEELATLIEAEQFDNLEKRLSEAKKTRDSWLESYMQRIVNSRDNAGKKSGGGAQ